MAEEEKPEQPPEGRKSMVEEKVEGEEKIENREKSRPSLQVTKSGKGGRMTIAERSLSRIKVRRTTFGFRGVPGTGPVGRSSKVALEFRRPVTTCLNTYRLDPHEPFHVPRVTNVINKHLDKSYGRHKYNPQESPGLAMRISGELMRDVKQMQFNRYRILSVVTIGQKRSQCYSNAVCFLWDEERDNYADVQRETATSFIQATVFAVYLD